MLRSLFSPAASLARSTPIASTSRRTLSSVTGAGSGSSSASPLPTPPVSRPPRKKFHPLSQRSPISLARDAPVPRPQRVPPAIAPIDTPASFLKAISTAPRRDLTADNSLVTLLGEDWAKMWELDSRDFKSAGVGIKERRYVLWSMEKFRQGWQPRHFKIAPKPKKKVRGWGPRVQKGFRVSGVKRPGEKSP